MCACSHGLGDSSAAACIDIAFLAPPGVLASPTLHLSHLLLQSLGEAFREHIERIREDIGKAKHAQKRAYQFCMARAWAPEVHSSFIVHRLGLHWFEQALSQQCCCQFPRTGFTLPISFAGHCLPEAPKSQAAGTLQYLGARAIHLRS